MDAKRVVPSSYDEEVAPPAYTDDVPAYQPYSSTSQYYSHQIQDQLQSITTQISSLDTQKSLLSHAKDERVLSLLTTQIQNYLSDFSKAGLHKGTLILVPAQGLEDENAVPVSYDFRKSDEYDKFVRVNDKEMDKSSDDGLMFWKDEDMARRLAGYLRPSRDPENKELPPRKEEIKAAAQQTSPNESRGFWGRKKSAIEIPRRSIPAREKMSPADPDAKSTQPRTEDKVLMDVRAEEVVFRTENDLGLYETQSGWGMVLKLRVVLGER